MATRASPILSQLWTLLTAPRYAGEAARGPVAGPGGARLRRRGGRRAVHPRQSRRSNRSPTRGT
eukprot:8672538-Pyramimonas_sp.AAC.1